MAVMKVGDGGKIVPRTHKRKDRRVGSTKRGYTYRWQAFRRRYLRDHPTCTRCGDKATQAHHRDRLGPKGPRGYDEANLEPLCHGCHSSETAGGGG